MTRLGVREIDQEGWGMVSSYGKIYGLGHRCLANLFVGDVVVEEKVDGSQISFGVDRIGAIHIRSKNKEIDIDAPDNMFAAGVEQIILRASRMREGVIFRGEYLQKPKHNTLAYNRVPQDHIVIFDVEDPLFLDNEAFAVLENKTRLAESIGLECVPGSVMSNVDSVDRLRDFMESESFLKGPLVEGVVIKNYGQVDPTSTTGRPLMGKCVSEAFKETHRGDWKDRNPGKKDIIERLSDELRSPVRWQKAVQHLRDDGELTQTPKDIGPLLRAIADDLSAECKDGVADALVKWAWPQIQRHAMRGFPEWYKEKLMETAFTPDTSL